jgi:hypothetical protein
MRVGVSYERGTHVAHQIPTTTRAEWAGLDTHQSASATPLVSAAGCPHQTRLPRHALKVKEASQGGQRQLSRGGHDQPEVLVAFERGAVCRLVVRDTCSLRSRHPMFADSVAHLISRVEGTGRVSPSDPHKAPSASLLYLARAMTAHAAWAQG